MAHQLAPALELPLEALVLCSDEEASLFLTIAALGRTLQQLVLQEQLPLLPPGATTALPLSDPFGAAHHQQRLRHCLQSLFTASIQLRQRAELNEAAAAELRTQPTCLELALERQVLAGIQAEVAARAAAVCAHRSRVLLPPLAAAMAGIKAAAAAALMAIHSGPGATANQQCHHHQQQQQPQGAPQLDALAQCTAATGQPAGPPFLAPRSSQQPAAAAGAMPGATQPDQLQRTLELLQPSFQRLAASLQHTLCPAQLQGQWHEPAHQPSAAAQGPGCSATHAPAVWQAQAPHHARARCQQLPLPRAAAVLPSLAPPSLLPLPQPATRSLPPSTTPQPVMLRPSPAEGVREEAHSPQPESGSQLLLAQPLQRQGPPAAKPRLLPLFEAGTAPVEAAQAEATAAGLMPGDAPGGATQPEAAAAAEQPGCHSGAGQQQAQQCSADEQEARLVSNPAAVPILAAGQRAHKWSALRGDAAPSSSTEGSDPQHGAGGGTAHSPQTTTAAAAGQPSPGGQLSMPRFPAFDPSLPPQPPEGGSLSPRLDPAPAPAAPAALPFAGASLPPLQLTQVQRAEQPAGPAGDSDGSQLALLQCTLRPPSRAGAPGVGCLPRGAAQRAQQDARGLQFQFPAVPPLPDDLQQFAWGAAGAGEAAALLLAQPAGQQPGGAAPAAATAVQGKRGQQDVGVQTDECKKPRVEGAGAPAAPAGGPAAAAQPAKAGRGTAGAAGTAGPDPGEEDKENRDCSQSQEDPAPLTQQQAEPEGSPGAGAAANAGAAAGAAGAGHEGGGSPGLRPLVAPHAAAAAAAACDMRACPEQQVAGAHVQQAGGGGAGAAASPGGSAAAATQPASQPQPAVQPASQPWPQGPTGMSTPAAAALLLDSQRDSNSPHHCKQGRTGPGAPDSGGKSGGSGSGSAGSGRASGVPGAAPLSEEPAAPLAPAPPTDMGCGQAQEAPTAAQAPQQRDGSAGLAPSPLLLLPGLLSAAAHHRKRPLSQDAEGHYKRSRFAIESQEAAEEAAAAAGAAAGSPQGLAAANPANATSPVPQATGGLDGQQDAAEPEGGAGLSTGITAGGAAGCQPTLGGLVGSEGEGGIICTQPPHITAKPLPAAAPPGCPATATAAWQGAAPTPAWEALALAEQWAPAGTPQLLAKCHTGREDATPQLGLSVPGTTPMAVALGAGAVAAAGRGPAALHPSASKFAGAAPGATPRFIFPSSCGDGPSPPAGDDSGAGTVQGHHVAHEPRRPSEPRQCSQ